LPQPGGPHNTINVGLSEAEEEEEEEEEDEEADLRNASNINRSKRISSNGGSDFNCFNNSLSIISLSINIIL
jgi:hypothetical protein